jgi:hypothetical protein
VTWIHFEYVTGYSLGFVWTLAAQGEFRPLQQFIAGACDARHFRKCRSARHRQPNCVMRAGKTLARGGARIIGAG